jgi:antitoxin ParD1/3/4
LTPTAAAESFRGDRIPNQEQDMSFPLPPEFERAVLDRVRSGQFASPEEVLSVMVELLEEREAEYETRLEELRRDIRIGLDQLDRGEAVTGAEVFDLLPVGRAAARGDDAAVAQAMDAIRHRCGVPLGVRYRGFVDEAVRSGRYASPTEVLEAALWLLRDAESPETDEALEALQREIAIGVESEKRDPMVPGEEVEAWLRARVGGGAR